MGPSVHSKNTAQSFFLRITPNKVSGNRVADGRAIHHCAANNAQIRGKKLRAVFSEWNENGLTLDKRQLCSQPFSCNVISKISKTYSRCKHLQRGLGYFLEE